MESKHGRYYGPALALVHHRGFGFHADACAQDVLDLLEPVRDTDGVVLELGCGSGALTRHLVAAGHRVIATDASPAMLQLARQAVPGVEELRELVLPDDPLPAADAVVSVGHALNYLGDEAAILRALAAIAGALRPGGVLALDLCDLRWAAPGRDRPSLGRVGDDWAIITRYSVPRPDRFVREITTFLRSDDGTWRRSDERHDSVLVDASGLPRLLSGHGLDARVASTFGTHELPDGLVAIIAERSGR